MKRLFLLVTLLLNSVMSLFADGGVNTHLIDLSLPSGTLWLDHNLGAINSYDFGEYYLGVREDIAESLLGSGYSTPTKEQFQELIDHTTQYWGENNGIEGMFFSAKNGNSIFLPAAAQLYSIGDDDDDNKTWDINNEGSGAYWTSTASDYDNYMYFLEFDDGIKSSISFSDRKMTGNRLSIRPVFYNPITCTVYKSSESRHVGEPAKGFCADGSSELKITYKSGGFKLENFADLKFYIADQLVEKEFSGSIQNIEYFSDSINIILQAPADYLAEGTSYDVDLVITPSSSETELKQNHFTYSVFRPGVLFFHGLGDNFSLFDRMIESIKKSGTHLTDQLLSIDYSASNTSSFYTNTHVNHVVKKGCYELQDKIFNERGIICSRFDMIGHSMGGILIRLFVQEDNGEPFTNKILTLNTPHFGSELGNIAVWADNKSAEIQNISNPNDSEKNYTIIHKLLTKTLFRNDHSLDALTDLSISSDAIVSLNGPSSILLHNIPVHAMCSVIPDMNSGYFTAPSPFILPQLLFGMFKLTVDSFIGDGVVPLDSQLGGLTQSSTVYSGDVINAFHCNSPKWENYITSVCALLKESKGSEVFSMNGFGESETRSLRQASTTEANINYVEEFKPIDKLKSALSLRGEISSVDEKKLNLVVNRTDDIQYSFIFGITDNEDILYKINSAENDFDLSKYDFNKITFYAVGRTDYHAILMDSVTIDKDLNVSSISMVEDGDQNYCISKNGESITITSKDCADFEVSVFDTTGKLVRRIKATEYLSINGLCKGICILNIRSKGNNQTCKILI